MNKAQIYYENNIKVIEHKLKKIESDLKKFAIIRLLIVILVFTLGYYFYSKNNMGYIVVSFLVCLTIFLVVAFFHNEKINEKNKEIILLEFNKKGLQRLNGEWKKFKDKGDEYLDLSHNFVNDLDMFGKNSFFQWINTTLTIFGRENLSNKLRFKETIKKEEILRNQEAIKELKNKRNFIENLYVFAKDKDNKKNKIEDLINWANKKTEVNLLKKTIHYIFLSITMISIFLIIIKKMPTNYILIVFLINYIVIKILTKDFEDIIKLFIKHKRSIINYSNMLTLIQDENFDSEKLKELKKSLLSDNVSCKNEMKKLKNIINWLGDSQSNAYYIIINVLFLSDLFIVNNLENWRKRNGDKLEKWLQIIGEFEAMSSLSNLAFEHEDWVYAKINDFGHIRVKNVAHPMISEKAIGNDFSLIDKKVALITGSNMSGKSTFLRSIGTNIILSYLGLPTNSDEFVCGIYKIYTCMRTQDNLEENISSFYAEILRIKLLIQAGKRNENVFFLLDEIFKGTNSIDRHDGAKMLIEQLVNSGGIGLVSTHDLELCELENKKTWLINFNFREYYEDGKIKFDYTLRNGKSETRNAKHLMKLAGIDIE